TLLGYRGVGKHVTTQRRVERLLRLEQRSTRRLAASVPPPHALGRALQTLCETEGSDCAEIWRVDERGDSLRQYAHWFNPDDAGARRFIEGGAGDRRAP